MNTAKIGQVSLELTFNYKFVYSKRISIEKTINNVIVQTQPYVLRDTFIEFEYPHTNSTMRDLFLSLYQEGTTFQFTTYTNEVYNCIIVEYEEDKKAGYYYLKGKFLILSVI